MTIIKIFRLMGSMKVNPTRLIITAILLTLTSGLNARTFLVAVGIADYSNFPSPAKNLTLTSKDAKTIVDLFTKNTAVDYSLLIDEKATKSRIIKAIDLVINKAEENDIAIFFFSGHGYPGGFCAYDGTLSYGEIRNAMAKSKSNNKMMFIDACHSGGIRVDKNVSQKALAKAKNANVMLFLSSRDNEYSIERRDMENGYFTTYLKNGLRGNADTNRDRVITAKELFKFVNTGVSNISEGKQHPVMWGKFNDNMPVMKW